MLLPRASLTAGGPGREAVGCRWAQVRIFASFSAGLRLGLFAGESSRVFLACLLVLCVEEEDRR